MILQMNVSPLLLKLQKESSKIISLLGDFNIEISDSINNFIDTLSSSFLLYTPYIFTYNDL